MHWVVKYKNKETASSENTKYSEIDRKKVAPFKIYDGEVEVFSTKDKDFVFRKRHFLDASGKHKETIYLFGNLKGQIFEYDLGYLVPLVKPDLEYTQDELLYI